MGRDPIYYHTLHVAVKISSVSLKMETVSAFLCPFDLDIFQERRPGILFNVPHFEFV